MFHLLNYVLKDVLKKGDKNQREKVIHAQK